MELKEIREALDEYERMIAKLYRIAESIYKPIPGASLVKTWVKGNGGIYEYWYWKGPGISIYVGGALDISKQALEMAKKIRRKAPKAIEAIQTLQEFLAIAEKADMLELEIARDKVRDLFEGKVVEEASRR